MTARPSPSLPLPLLASLALLTLACSGARDLRDDEPAEPAPGAVPGATPPGGRQPTDAPPIADGPIYVNGPYTLYTFAPQKALLRKVGDFDCLLSAPSGTADSGMHDLAVDSQGHLYGVAKVRSHDPVVLSANVIVTIDPNSGHCSEAMTIDDKLLDPRGGLELRGLSFVPAGTVSPSEEVLVGLEIYGSYVELDLQRQQARRLGSLSGDGPDGWKTKGADIVSILGADTYSTVQGPRFDERLVAIDPRTGRVKKDLGTLGDIIFGGLAYWGGTLYGFTVAGKIFAIDPNSAARTEIPVLAPADTRFDGAGVTTTAPILPPG